MTNLIEKAYETFEEEQRRFTYFIDNHEKVTQHNVAYENGDKTYKMKLNKFADMEHKEFVQAMNGFKRSLRDPAIGESPSTFLAPANVIVPQSVDWRTQGYVTPVKDQVLSLSMAKFFYFLLKLFFPETLRFLLVL